MFSRWYRDLPSQCTRLTAGLSVANIEKRCHNSQVVSVNMVSPAQMSQITNMKSCAEKRDVKAKSILESCTVHTAIITVFLSLSISSKVQSFFLSFCCRITPDSSLNANRNHLTLRSIDSLGRAEGLVLLCYKI